MTEIRNAVCSWRMALAVFLVVAILTNPFYLDIVFLKNMWSYMSHYDVLDLITTPMALSGFVPFACIFPMLPCGTRFAEEYNSNYIRFTLPRSGENFLYYPKNSGESDCGRLCNGVCFCDCFHFSCYRRKSGNAGYRDFRILCEHHLDAVCIDMGRQICAASQGFARFSSRCNLVADGASGIGYLYKSLCGDRISICHLSGFMECMAGKGYRSGLSDSGRLGRVFRTLCSLCDSGACDFTACNSEWHFSVEEVQWKIERQIER